MPDSFYELMDLFSLPCTFDIGTGNKVNGSRKLILRFSMQAVGLTCFKWIYSIAFQPLNSGTQSKFGRNNPGPVFVLHVQPEFACLPFLRWTSK
ncbi:hypothetical protein [Undibacterium sp. TC9W]|uniref:hypothetical protein n=1 Tax=Undibacterium sp. TC9W TaxID=3413053 RepID=UPI003BEF8B1D